MKKVDVTLWITLACLVVFTALLYGGRLSCWPNPPIKQRTTTTTASSTKCEWCGVELKKDAVIEAGLKYTEGGKTYYYCSRPHKVKHLEQLTIEDERNERTRGY